jgi:hypothetical protein
MNLDRKTHGWSGTVRNFLDQPVSLVEQSLESHLFGLLGFNAANSQVEAWLEELEVLRISFRDLAISKPDSLNWSVILEYELPLEGGRRPDVVVLGPGSIFVLEFKQDPTLSRSAIDQVAAYARDLAEYHSKTHGIQVLPILVPSKTAGISESRDVVQVVSPDKLASLLDSFEGENLFDLDDWLSGDYAPLPTLIAAAKMIFRNERLPSIKRAESYGVSKAVDRLKEIAKSAQENSERTLAFVSGVPGAGKTLVGLQLVYESSDLTSQAVFLSGNGPLVEVLRDALKSKSFVSDLHAYIKSYGTTSKIPKQHVVVFDEAQRAWDASYMMIKKNIPHSEPDLLISIGEKIEDWVTLVGLIGHGQEIHTGEEAGIAGWNSALHSDKAKSNWKVHIPPRFKDYFPEVETFEHNELDLNRTLRSKQAETLHTWVESVLEGKLPEANILSQKIWMQNFPIFITRDLVEAKNYLNDRFENEPSKRFGILASSKDRILPEYGIHNDFHSTKMVKNAKWYNNGLGEDGSCCNLDKVVTEFGCQGLEVDMAIVAWGNDYLWDGNSWNLRTMRTRIPQEDPHQLRKNSYRVLLTRSREGVIIFVPPRKEFDATENAILAAGARHLRNSIPLSAIS